MPLSEPDNEVPARRPVFALFLLGIVALAGAWLAWEEARPAWSADFPVAQPKKDEAGEQALEKLALSHAPADAGAPLVAESPPKPEAAMPSPPVTEPEIRRAEMPGVAEKVALNPTPELLRQTGDLLSKFLAAGGPDERLALIATPEEHAVDVAEFFEPGPPVVSSLAYANATPQSLPGGMLVPLFQVVTDRCRGGALLRLAPQEDGRLLLDWPLFAETHGRRLAGFIEKRPDAPAWFHVGMRRSHALDLPAEFRGRHFGFDLQGGADGSVRCVAVAARETPLGRFFERETEWGVVYLARVLLQHRLDETAGRVIVILDCEGASTGASKAGPGQ